MDKNSLSIFSPIPIVLQNSFLGKASCENFPKKSPGALFFFRKHGTIRKIDSILKLQLHPKFTLFMNILYADGPVLVLNKPSGILVQSPPGIDSLVDQIKNYVREKEERAPDANVYLGVPHRLDRPASGAMVFARNVRAAKRLSDQFQMRMITKKYWVLVQGIVAPEHGDWEDFLRKVPDEARAEVVSPHHPEGRWAMLHYTVRKTFPQRNCTWLEIELETGRTHQIRVQASTRGFPILGDAQYGSSVPFGEPFEDERLRAIALHSRILEFRHPMREERVHIEAPLPETWRSYLPEEM